MGLIGDVFLCGRSRFGARTFRSIHAAFCGRAVDEDVGGRAPGLGEREGRECRDAVEFPQIGEACVFDIEASGLRLAGTFAGDVAEIDRTRADMPMTSRQSVSDRLLLKLTRGRKIEVRVVMARSSMARFLARARPVESIPPPSASTVSCSVGANASDRREGAGLQMPVWVGRPIRSTGPRIMQAPDNCFVPALNFLCKSGARQIRADCQPPVKPAVPSQQPPYVCLAGSLALAGSPQWSFSRESPNSANATNMPSARWGDLGRVTIAGSGVRGAIGPSGCRIMAIAPMTDRLADVRKTIHTGLAREIRWSGSEPMVVPGGAGPSRGSERRRGASVHEKDLPRDIARVVGT